MKYYIVKEQPCLSFFQLSVKSTFPNVPSSSDAMIGFARCPFIPAALDAAISSSNAFAETASTGILASTGSSRALIARVAAYPSITGWYTSIAADYFCLQLFSA